jgi:hypothetical protein
VTFLFIINVILTNGISQDGINRNLFVSMPVATRLQAKRAASLFKDFSHASSLDSSKELSENIIINSSKELSLLDSTTSSKDHSTPVRSDHLLSLVPVNNNNDVRDITPHLLSIELHCHCPSTPASSFQNFEFGNLEFSNIQHNDVLNSSTSLVCHNSRMEEDCKQPVGKLTVPCNEVDIGRLIANLSSHITTQVTSIQDQIVKNKVEISNDFQRIVQENETFKGDIHAELDGIRNLLNQHQISSHPSSVQNFQAGLNPDPLVTLISVPPKSNDANVNGFVFEALYCPV